MRLAALAALLAACSGEAVNPAPHGIDLGDGTVAVWYPDDRLDIQRDNVSIVKSKDPLALRSLSDVPDQ